MDKQKEMTSEEDNICAKTAGGLRESKWHPHMEYSGCTGSKVDRNQMDLNVMGDSVWFLK